MSRASPKVSQKLYLRSLSEYSIVKYLNVQSRWTLYVWEEISTWWWLSTWMGHKCNSQLQNVERPVAVCVQSFVISSIRVWECHTLVAYDINIFFKIPSSSQTLSTAEGPKKDVFNSSLFPAIHFLLMIGTRFLPYFSPNAMNVRLFTCTAYLMTIKH